MAEDYPDEFDEFYNEEVKPFLELGLSSSSDLKLSSDVVGEFFHLLKEDYQDNYELEPYEVILGQIFQLVEVEQKIDEEFEQDKPKKCFVEYFYGLDDEESREKIDVDRYESDYQHLLYNRRETVISKLIDIIDDFDTEKGSEGVEELSDNSTESGLEFNFGNKDEEGESSGEDSLESLTEEIEQSGPKEAIDEAYQGGAGVEENGENLNDVIDSFLQDDEKSEDDVTEDSNSEVSQNEATDEDVEEAVKDAIDEAFEKEDSN